jgi:hypothetical protein
MVTGTPTRPHRIHDIEGRSQSQSGDRRSPRSRTRWRAPWRLSSIPAKPGGAPLLFGLLGVRGACPLPGKRPRRGRPKGVPGGVEWAPAGHPCGPARALPGACWRSRPVVPGFPERAECPTSGSPLTPNPSWPIVAKRLRQPRSHVVAVGSVAGRKPGNLAEAREMAHCAGIVWGFADHSSKNSGYHESRRPCPRSWHGFAQRLPKRK